jgi:hypothetical protein
MQRKDMINSQATTLVQRPVEDVYGFICVGFYENYPRWCPEVLELRPLSPGPLKVGSVARQVRRDHGRRTEATFRVVDMVEHSHVVFESITRPHFRCIYRFEPHGEATRVALQFELRPELFLKPFEGRIRKVIRESTGRTLNNLKRILETEAALPATGSP